MMRVTGQSLYNSMINNTNLSKQRFDKLTTQWALQKRIVNPSDDPISSTQLAQLQREKASIDQYQTNIKRLSGTLGMQESRVKGIEGNVGQMLGKLQEANNANLGAEELKGYGAELKTMLDTLMTDLNSKDENGHYSFAGTKSDKPPFVQDPVTGQWSFQGNKDSASTIVGNGVEVPSGVDLSEAFGGSLEMINKLTEFANKMEKADPADPVTNADFNDIIGLTESSHNNLSAVYTSIGGRINHLNLLQETHEEVGTLNQLVQDDLQQLNIPETYMKLNTYMYSAQASNQIFSKINSLSLFDLI
ncbi:flagellin/flagellar hook associated protein [Enterobacterales bacterium CwR94]|nr:flagellin/flagellar hook associated protein [Enterobacterales bacterium CwR94]